MLEVIIDNLVMVGWFMLAAAACVVGALCSSIYTNVFKFDEAFDFKYFLRGVIKSFVFISSFFWFAIGVTMLPILLAEYELINITLAEDVNILVCIVILIKVATVHLSKTYENWKIVFELSEEEVATAKFAKTKKEELMYE